MLFPIYTISHLNSEYLINFELHTTYFFYIVSIFLIGFNIRLFYLIVIFTIFIVFFLFFAGLLIVANPYLAVNV